MTTPQKHWNAIFFSKVDAELGWYEQDVSQTLKFLEAIPRREIATIFLPDAGTSALVDELLARGYRLILNDISDVALEKLMDRTGAHEQLSWLHHDISQPLPDGPAQADLWIDRAVLHFLLDEADIHGYFDNLGAAVRPGGYALLAEFSTAGAPKCAGLDVHRYSVEELTARIGGDFELMASEEYTYVNPFGDPRPYVYALYRKRQRANPGRRKSAGAV